MRKTRFFGIVITFLLTLSLLAAAVATTVCAASLKGEISVWIIAGQSNAEGYGLFADEASAFSSDSRYSTGFDDVLYWGNHEDGGQDTTDFVKVKLGQGQNKNSSGAEIGIASAASAIGGKHAVIKCAIGSTFLYPYTSSASGADVSTKKHGTWTSPSFVKDYLPSDVYAKNNPENADDGIITGTTASNGNEIIGNMYRMLVDLTLTPAIARLKELGYTPKIRGMWWMQGEAETWISFNSNNTDASLTGDAIATTAYSNLLKCLIKDVRAALTTIVGEDCSKMPFVIGRLHRNTGKDANGNTYSTPTYLAAIQAAQDKVARDPAMINVGIVDPSSYSGLAQRDGWHFKSTTQKYLGEQFVYTALGMAGTETPYGYIPPEHASVSDYPLAVFDGKGNFIMATNQFGIDNSNNGHSALNSAKLSGDGAVVLLRKNFAISGKYANLSQVRGTITVDLGGFTLSHADNANHPLFYADAKPLGNEIFHSHIIVKNGTVSVGANPALRFSSWEGTAKLGGKQFDFTFSDVKFTVGSGTTNVVAETYNETGDPRADMTLTLKGCSFDLSEKTGLTLINSSDTTDTLKLDAIIEGCEIKADSQSSYKIFAADSEMGSEIKYGTWRSEYIKITLPSSAAAPTGTLKSVCEGDLVFDSGKASGASVVYQPKSKLLGSFKVSGEKTASSLAMKLYVPKISAISEIKLGDKTLDTKMLFTVTRDGGLYYVITAPITAKNAFDEITLTVKANSGGSSITSTYKFNPLDCARAALDASPSDDEAALLRSALSYERAASLYFGGDSVAAEEALTLTGRSYDRNNKPSFTSDAVKPNRANGMAGVTLVLGEKPAVRFYPYGVSVDDFTFKQGTKTLDTKTGKDNIGAYVEVYPDLADLTDTISYTVKNSTKSGSYNLRSYYDWAKTRSVENPALFTLVERLAKYSEEAKS